jgi:hypothetical protein
MNLSQLPAFVLSVIVLSWSPTIGCFLNAVQFYKLVGKRNDAFKWCAVRISRRALSAAAAAAAAARRLCVWDLRSLGGGAAAAGRGSDAWQLAG